MYAPHSVLCSHQRAALMPRSKKTTNRGLAGVTKERSDYLMANRRNAQSRRRKGVPSQGAQADYHYRNQGDWLWMRELAWDMYRNNMILGSVVDRAIETQLQSGLHTILRPATPSWMNTSRHGGKKSPPMPACATLVPNWCFATRKRSFCGQPWFPATLLECHSKTAPSI